MLHFLRRSHDQIGMLFGPTDPSLLEIPFNRFGPVTTIKCERVVKEYDLGGFGYDYGPDFSGDMNWLSAVTGMGEANSEYRSAHKCGQQF